MLIIWRSGATVSHLTCGPFLVVPKSISIGAKGMLEAPLDVCRIGPIAEGKNGPVAVLGVPPRSPDNPITGARMLMAPSAVTAMECFLIPYVLDHHVTVKIFDIVCMVFAACQLRPYKEGFSFRIG